MKQTIDYFKDISVIPRASGSEEKIAGYICDLADKNRLYRYRDSADNVLVKKPATPGYENRPSVLLTAHTDMVCEKTPDSVHDFSGDAIKIIEKDGFLSADKTTLGADNGGGVAVMLRLMENNESPHPQLEFLFTSSEETGMQGAAAFDYSLIDSDFVINLDSENFSSVCIGCAGGSRYRLEIPVERTRNAEKLYQVEITGLSGGHSGTDISKNRKNALKISGELLSQINDKYPICLASLSAGGKDNVIPVYARATFEIFRNSDLSAVRELCSDFYRSISDSLEACDRKKFRIKFKKFPAEAENLRILSFKSTFAVISALLLAPFGVTEFIPGTAMPSASVNLGIAELGEKFYTGVFLSRYGSEFSDLCTGNRLASIASLLGGRLTKESSYPGWPYKRGSALQSAYEKAFSEISGNKPLFESVHAGLECGIFSSKLSALGKTPDIISVGPDLYAIHTVNEKMDISSLEKLYAVVCRTFEYIR